MGDTRFLFDDAHRFCPAAPDEKVVYGACSPGWHSAGDHDRSIDDWLTFMHSQDIERVCCLLTGRQLDHHDANVGRYRTAFGDSNVIHVPIPDYHLADLDTLREEVLPFLDATAADDASVVVHCLAGIGRTGQVLAAWLVWGRGYDPHEAVDTVRSMGREPFEAVQQGNATRQDLLDLLGLLAGMRI